MSPYTFSSTLHWTDGHIAGLASKLFFAEEFEESPLASVVSGVRLFSADEREAESTVAGVGLPGGPVARGQPKGRRASQSHIVAGPVGQP